jgi:hypothetical protein
VLFSICKQWINNSIIRLILFNFMINKENDKSCFLLDRNRNLEIVNYSKPVLAMNTDPLVQDQ